MYISCTDPSFHNWFPDFLLVRQNSFTTAYPINCQNKLVWQLGSVHKKHIHLEASSPFTGILQRHFWFGSELTECKYHLFYIPPPRPLPTTHKIFFCVYVRFSPSCLFISLLCSFKQFILRELTKLQNEVHCSCF